ncbi:DUF4097 family beta strand repeat-containing protein [Streptomyces sp. ICBB 8177]|uniref:DUF4097 family beta strand repeat-containing protein n=1 Tax=Streptomyces sp. ICBB 8177 TaxID=563922 RepID=UPI000D67B5AB|nr:DUF4097 family beta strand repeat-containing protein [Streptomyces sp. ICBB 8177]PWI43182.1 hypothetical protein CK485_13425 [Streptomyces sp. ICBB 8177]
MSASPRVLAVRTPTRNRAHAAGLLALATCAALAVSGCSSSSGDSDPQHKDFALAGTSLTIDSDDSALDVRPADVKDVQVTRWFSAHTLVGSKPSVSWAMDGSTLRLRLHCSGIVADCSVRHQILVPRGVAVTVKDGNGAVTASGFSRPLCITSGNGAVDVSGSTGTLTLDSGNGRIVASGVRSKQVRAGTSNGQVRIDFAAVPDRVSTSTSDGPVTIGLPRASYAVTATSDNGHASVSVPQDSSSGHVVTAHSSNGSITVRTAS